MRSFDPSLLVLVILAALVVGAPPASSQEVFRSEATEVQITLPDGWDGSREVQESTLPGRAVYRFEATTPGIAGTAVVVERVVGLNPLAEEQFRRGQVPFGYHGFRPTAALAEDAMVFGPSAGLVIEAGERVGRAYFVQRGRVFWAVHVAAPLEVLAEQPGLLDTLARGIRLSEKEVQPPEDES